MLKCGMIHFDNQMKECSIVIIYVCKSLDDSSMQDINVNQVFFMKCVSKLFPLFIKSYNRFVRQLLIDNIYT